MLISVRDSAHAFSVKYIPRMCVAVIDRRNGCNLSASRENCTAWLHEVLLAMLMEQHTVVFLYQLAQARPNMCSTFSSIHNGCGVHSGLWGSGIQIVTAKTSWLLGRA